MVEGWEVEKRIYIAYTIMVKGNNWGRKLNGIHTNPQGNLALFWVVVEQRNTVEAQPPEVALDKDLIINPNSTKLKLFIYKQLIIYNSYYKHKKLN